MIVGLAIRDITMNYSLVKHVVMDVKIVHHQHHVHNVIHLMYCKIVSVIYNVNKIV